MSFANYVLHRIPEMDYRAMMQRIQALRAKSNKGSLPLLFDMAYCALFHGAGYVDYDLFEMYAMDAKQRSTVLTRGRNDALVKAYNDPAYHEVFSNKCVFNAVFSSFVRREWIDVSTADRASLRGFIERHPVFMLKPVSGSCGKGIEKLNAKDYLSLENVLEDVLSRTGERYELEEVASQHPALSAIYPDAVNTVRLVTLLEGGTAYCLYAFFRIGNGGRVVDNFNSNVLLAPVDISTGVVALDAVDKEKNLYKNHPVTGEAIRGFSFPYWEEALAMCMKAAKVIPQIRYVGWDVCFGEDGPLLIEGNDYPGHDITSMPALTPQKIGVYPLFAGFRPAEPKVGEPALADV